MTVDERISQAIREAVAEAGQPNALARRLIAWVEEVMLENEDINDWETAVRHLEVLFEGTKVKNANGEHEDQ